MASQERKNEIHGAITKAFPNAHIREYEFGFKVYLVPRHLCANRIWQNCPVQIDITFMDDSDKLQIRAQIDVKPSNPLYFCENAAKKHKLNKTIQAGKPFAPYLQLFADALQEENTNIIHNDDLQYQCFFYNGGVI